MSEDKKLKVEVQIVQGDKVVTIDITPQLDATDITDLQELRCDEELRDFVLEAAVEQRRFTPEKIVPPEKFTIQTKDDTPFTDEQMEPYLLYMLREETEKERMRADTALGDFKDADGEVYSETYRTPLLSVNVKCYEFGCPPELKESVEDQIREWEIRDFWNFDMDDARENNDDKHFGEHDFPKIYSAGRSSGHLTFEGTEGAAKALIEYGRPSEFRAQGGATDEGTIEDAAGEWDSTFYPDDAYTHVEDMRTVYTDMSEFFESATKWVEHVKACMADRVSNIKGEHLGWLENHIENERYELFDLDDCTIKVEGGEFLVSWPQHARQFTDVGEWKKCHESYPNAKVTERYSFDAKDGMPGYERDVYGCWVPAEAKAFSFKIDKRTFIETLLPELQQALSLLSVKG